MRYFKSEEKAYNPKNKKNIPVWKLDAESCIVTHFDKETSEVHETVFSTDFIRYHIHYSMNKYPGMPFLLKYRQLSRQLNTKKLSVIPMSLNFSTFTQIPIFMKKTLNKLS